MELVHLGQRSGYRIPRVNIGAMRFPEDDDAAVNLIRHAIDSGMRYIDTSRGYGRSELKLAKALREGYRDKVILSTKWSPWVTKIEEDDSDSADCVRRRIEEQLDRLDVESLDFYQVWNIHSRECYEQATRPGGMVEGMLKARQEGLVNHLGFTTHDSPDNLMDYLPHVDWAEVVLFSYNLLNRRYAEVIEAYHRAGIGTIVMNPVGGGKLAQSSDKLMQLAREVGAQSVPDLAIRYILSNPHIDTVICGLTRLQDVDDSIASAQAGPFEEGAIERIQAFLRDIEVQQAAFCTSCGYCLPCPEGIDIPTVLSCLFEDQYWGLHEAARARYEGIKTPKADACVVCGSCEEQCTQGLNITELMQQCTELFGTSP